MQCLLSEKKITSIKAINKRQEFWDTLLLGFGMRVAKSGQKTFFVMCRQSGKQKRISLGRYPVMSLSEARNIARDKLRLVSLGLPLEEKPKAVVSLAYAFESFIELHAKKKTKSWRSTEMRLKKNLVKEFGSFDIREIKRENIIALLDKIVARNASTQANRIHAGSSKFFKWCAERGYIENSPHALCNKAVKRKSERSSAI